jgi:hypothetical protein
LIQIKWPLHISSDFNSSEQERRTTMPTDSLLVAIGVCVMFLVFATAVAWADHATSQWLRNKAVAKQATIDTKPPYHKAA